MTEDPTLGALLALRADAARHLDKIDAMVRERRLALREKEAERARHAAVDL
jgi:hypothetical protein